MLALKALFSSGSTNNATNPKVMLEQQAVAARYVQDLGAFYANRFEENKTESVDEFAARTGPDDEAKSSEKSLTNAEAKYLDVIQMTAEEFNASQAEKRKAAGLGKPQMRWMGEPEVHHPLRTRRTFEYKLSAEELDILLNHGTVLSSKSMANFGVAYSSLYSNDIPVYVSADSILHAWHHSFDSILEQVEVDVLSKCVEQVLTRILEIVERESIPENIANDIIHFAAVPLALLNGAQDRPHTLSALNSRRIRPVMDRITETLRLVAAERECTLAIFGPTPRVTDFSHFIPRGHYTKNEKLTNYFKAMMWLGRTEFELTKDTPDDIVAALCLEHMFSQDESVKEIVSQVSVLLTNFIGITDSMTFLQLHDFLAESGSELSFANYDHDRDGTRLLQLMDEADLGGQLINAQVREAADGIPRAVTFFGQKFTLDSWAMAQSVYPNLRNEAPRRIPSGVDVAYSVFGNDTAAPILASRMQGLNSNMVNHRDGFDFSANLKTLREIVDATPEEFWGASIYGMWIRTLRSLSETSGSPSWDRKTMHTQLASWAQLRHDTILYVKQGHTMIMGCEFPTVLVEPQPLFWASMQEMADQTRALIDGAYPEMEWSEEVTYPWGGSETVTRNTKHIARTHMAFLERFSQHIGRLRAMCEKQSSSQSLDEDDMAFMNQICTLRSLGSGGQTEWAGWYSELFFGANANVTKSPVLVADVHTDVPSPEHGDPGCIVHEGVGNVRLCYTVRSDANGDPSLYVGPIMEYYEPLTPYGVRLDDDAWKAELEKGTPRSPEWIGHLVVN